MRRNFATRLLLGAAATSPLMVVGLVLAVALGLRLPDADIGNIVIAVVILSIVLYAGSLGYFLYLVAREQSFDSSDKARWTYVLLLFFPFGAIAFWYRFVWSRPSERLGQS